MKTAAYLRVSTADQKLDLQMDGLRDYAGRAGLEVVTRYSDEATSGRKEGRPGLNALMRDARDRRFGCVLVWKFDRFARSTAHLLKALEEFRYLGIRFISVQDQIDTDSPMGKAMFTMIAAMAELESSLIAERVKAGMDAARKRGKQLGRPPAPPEFVQQAEHLARTTTLSITEITEALDGKLSRSKVGGIVRSVRTSDSQN